MRACTLLSIPKTGFSKPFFFLKKKERKKKETTGIFNMKYNTNYIISRAQVVLLRKENRNKKKEGGECGGHVQGTTGKWEVNTLRFPRAVFGRCCVILGYLYSRCLLQ